MNEMLARNINKGESVMKKTLVIVCLAMALMLALATPAFAKYAGFSSQEQYVPWAKAISAASLNADAALMASGPHSGYATTTIKCAVCHSVHRGGSKLLNDGSSCAFCHSSVANGGGAVASNLISWTAANGGPHSSRCANDDCHGGPHGVGASIYAGPASKLLTARADTKLLADATANGVSVASLATYDASTRALATGATCSREGCHTNSAMGVLISGTQLPADVDGVLDKMVTGHRVIASATPNWNSDGSMGTSKTTIGAIAYAPVDYCNDCHDLADDNNAGKAAFPHGITGIVDSAVGADGTSRPAVWLTAGAFAGDARTAVGPLSATGASVTDGVCLKCHRGSATTGVGIDF